MKNRENFIILFVLLCILTIMSPGQATAATIRDMAQRNVTVPDNPSQIIAIGPGALRLVCYLDARDKLVGIEKFEKIRSAGRPYWLASPKLKNLPIIGPGGPQHIDKEPDLEAVLKVTPQVIFATNMQASTADRLQKKIGIPVVILSYGPFPDFDENLFISLQLAGKILNKEGRAQAVSEYIQNAKIDLRDRTAGFALGSKPTVYIGGIGFRGLQGIESTNPTYMPLRWIQANNVAAGISGESHLFIDREKLLIWNPNVIFVDGGGYSLIKKDFDKKPAFYKGLKAFQDGRVFVLLPYVYYVANVGTGIADAYAAGKILYPDRFKDIDPAKKANEVYTFLLGKPVYEEMVKNFGKLGRKF